MAKRPLERALSEYFTAIGRKGGQVATAKLTKAERVERARHAVLTRWAKAKQSKKESR